MPDFKSDIPRPNAGEGSTVDLDMSEVLFEVRAIGNAVKVSAIDPVSNIEVCVVGSIHTHPYSLKMNALRKLKRMLTKRSE